MSEHVMPPDVAAQDGRRPRVPGAEGDGATRDRRAEDRHGRPESHREIEAKFAVKTARAVPELVGLDRVSDDYVLQQDRLLEISDTYFDTLDFALLRSGLVLRIRQIDGETKVTLKGLTRAGFGAIHERMEHESTLAPDVRRLDPSSWPREIRELVTASAGENPELAPVSMLEQSRYFRYVWRGSLPDDEAPPDAPGPVAELTIERVTVLDPDRAGVRRGEPEVVTRFAELEVELLPGGSVDELQEISRLLDARKDLSAAGESKFERALKLSAAHPPGQRVGVLGVQPNMTMSEAGRLVWRLQLTEILLNEAGARRGDDIEYVHDMRVATRRARAAFALFGDGFRRSSTKRFRKALKRTGRALGPVRDLDVALHKMAARRDEAAPADRAEMDALAASWTTSRESAYRDLYAWLDSEDYRRFIADFSVFCATPGAGVKEAAPASEPSPVPRQVRHIMPVEILMRFATVRAYESLFERDEPVAPEALHRLRIDCKRLRYGLEPVRHLLGADGARMIAYLKGVQDHLGDLNDAVVARERLLGLLEETRDDADASDGIERQLQVQEATMCELQESFPEVWSAFVSPKTRRLLMRALARF